MKSNMSTLSLILFLFACTYTAPEGDFSWGLWFLLAGAFVAAGLLAGRKHNTRRKKKTRTDVIYFPGVKPDSWRQGKVS